MERPIKWRNPKEIPAFEISIVILGIANEATELRSEVASKAEL